MAIADVLPNSSVSQAAKNKAELFDTLLNLTASNSNILAHLQGPKGSGKPFMVDTSLEKGQLESKNFNVGTTLGAAGRRGTQTAQTYEEGLIHGSWSVTLDQLRVVVSWDEINRIVKSSSGKVWEEVYAELCGQRVGQIEQEDMLMRFRQRVSTAGQTIRPGNKASLNALTYSDTVDTAALARAISVLSTNGATPAKLAKGKDHGMPINGYCALGAEVAVGSLWEDQTFTNALLHAAVDGPENAFWTGDIPMWKNTAVKPWYIVNHDNPGPIGSSILPQAKLGDAVSGATTALTIYGGGRTQAALGSGQAALYGPFMYFLGCNYAFGESLTFGTDTGPYHFVIIDPADGKWCLYEYAGSSGINASSAGVPGNSITCTKRLAAAASGTAYTTIGDWTWDASVNKVAFPTGSLIVQVNAKVVPISDIWVFSGDCAAKVYGAFKNKRIQQELDYGQRKGYGVASIYGSDVARDTQDQVRGVVRLQVAYDLPGYDLPNL